MAVVCKRGIAPFIHMEAKVPTDLRKALAVSPKTKALWKDLTANEKRDFTTWIDAAKELEANRRRIEKACAMLATGKRRP